MKNKTTKMIQRLGLACSVFAYLCSLTNASAGCYCAHDNIQFPAGCWSVGVPKCKSTTDTTSCFMNGGLVTVTVICVVGEDITITMQDCNTDDGNYCPGDWSH